MNFGQAFEEVKKDKGMRLPQWSNDVVIRAQFPDEHSKMTAPYLYVESCFGRVPWKETNIELFAENWEVVE
ncbi:Thoeris anti-defense Tad2 family protein [Bacillus thuringiensis]